ncbi:MAG: tetratricopeptide repeat protein [Candidatus Omnitrophota bacterium]|nr:tetratricopeptide repeat protein [Candidatus Omnitrophota bacterium]
MKRIPDFIIAPAIFIAALVLRIACLQQMNNSPFNPLYLDGEYYNSWAINIAKGDILGKGVFYGLPLYPYLLGLVYSIFGQNIFIAQVLNAMMDSASCILLYFIGKRIFNPRAGLAAAFIFAFFNMSFYFDAFLDSTSLSVLLYLSSLSLLLSTFARPRFFKWCLTGILAGIASLANATIIVFVPFVIILAFLKFAQNPGKGKVLAWTASMILALSLVISAVTVRNFMVARDFVPVTYHAGITFYAGNNPLSIGSFNLPESLGRGVRNTMEASRNAAEKALARRLKPSEISGYWFRQGLAFIKEDPARYLRLIFKKAYLFWWTRPIPEGLPLKIVRDYSAVLRLPLFGYALISPLAIIGLIISYRKDNIRIAILYSFVSAAFLSTIIYFVNQRYRMIVMPVLILFASSALLYIYDAIRQKTYLRAAAGTGAALLLFLALNINFAAAREDIVFEQLGVSQALKGRFAEAEESFKRAIAIKPSNPMSHYNLGTLYLNLKRFNEAIKELEECLRLNPNYHDAHNNIGTIYTSCGRPEKALSHFENSLRLNPYQENIRMAVEDLKKRANSSKAYTPGERGSK